MSQAPPFERHAECFVDAGPYRTRYIEAGEAGRPAVVLVHDGAFGTDAELCWGDVIDALSSEFHVFAPELLGWGGTDKVVDFARSRYEIQIAHLANFVTAVGLDDGAHLVGASFGGSVVVRAAAAASASPLRMLSAVSISGTGGPFRRYEAVQRLGDYTPSLEAAREISRLLTDPARPTEEHVRRRYENSLIHGHWEALKAGQLRNPARTSRRDPSTPPTARFPEVLGRAEVPVLLVEGTRDPINEAGWSRKLRACCPRAEVVEMDSGHSPNLDRPAEVAAMISKFVTRVHPSL